MIFSFRYNINITEFKANGGENLLKIHNNSIFDVLNSHFPDFEFLPWLFIPVQRGYFDSLETRRNYINWLVKTVGVENPGKLKNKDFVGNGGSGLLVKFGSAQKIVESLNGNDSNPHQKPKGYWVFYYFYMF